MTVTITIGPGLNRKMKKAVETGKVKGARVLDELARIGQRYAKSIVPVHTGKTMQLIKVMSKRGKGGAPRRQIVSQNSTRSDGHIRNIKNFSLPKWMDESPRALRHIKTGDPKYMDKTVKYLNSIKSGIIGKQNK